MSVSSREDGRLRLVPEESEPLSLPELKTLGDRLLADAKNAAGDALMTSMRPEFLMRNVSYNLRDVRRMQQQAHDAGAAWAKVERLLSELLLEVERAKGGA